MSVGTRMFASRPSRDTIARFFAIALTAVELKRIRALGRTAGERPWKRRKAAVEPTEA